MAKEEILSVSDSFIHIKSDEVPDWVKGLEEFKSKIRDTIVNKESEIKIQGVTFCHPINVPPTE